MAKYTKLAAASLMLACCAAGAQQAVRTVHDMSLELANQLAGTVVAACLAEGYNVSATVVDRAGTVRAVQRADDAGANTLSSSERKAWTATSLKTPTQALMERSMKSPEGGYLVHLPGVLLLGGGVPVKVGNEVIGAIGVGGAPGGQLDERCANAAIEKARNLNLLR